VVKILTVLVDGCAQSLTPFATPMNNIAKAIQTNLGQPLPSVTISCFDAADIPHSDYTFAIWDMKSGVVKINQNALEVVPSLTTSKILKIYQRLVTAATSIKFSGTDIDVIVLFANIYLVVFHSN
jgi:hypothetical protein